MPMHGRAGTGHEMMMGGQHIVASHIVVGAVLAIAIGVAGLVSLLLAIFRQT